MSYLKYDKTVISNLEQSLQLETLATDGSGAFSCTTICGCNTRKYHGELIVPSQIPGKTNLLLISTLDEEVVLRGVEYRLGTHSYDGGVFAPSGYQYQVAFEHDEAQVSTYRIADTVIEKSKLFVGDHRLVVRYRIVAGADSVKLMIRPHLAFRDTSELCIENVEVNKTYGEVAGGVAVCLYDKYPTLYMQTSSPSLFLNEQSWVKGVHYFQERDRGYHDREDLFVLGKFEVELSADQPIYLSCGLSEMAQKKIATSFEGQIKKAAKRSDLSSTLEAAAQSFFVKKKDGLTLLAGYPWKECVARDMFIALPGATVYAGDTAAFDSVMQTVMPLLDAMMSSRASRRQTAIERLDDPDVMLWIIWALQQYAEVEGTKEMWTKYGDLISRMITYIMKGKHPKIEHTGGALLYIHGWQQPQTWMNAKDAYGLPITPRSGFVVEINALWYNALAMVASITQSTDIESETEKVAESFLRTFWNGIYLFDFVDGDRSERCVRPSMLMAVALKYSPLDSLQKKSILDIATRELLTPKGLRSQSQRSSNYHGACVGGQLGRGYAAFQGSAYPWLMGMYVESYLKVYRQSGIDFVRRSMLGIEDEVLRGTLGYLGETFDGNPPFRSREAMASAVNVCEVIRAYRLIKDYTKLIKA